VDFDNEEGVRRIESAIAFANPIKDVDTSKVEPMYSVLDGETLRFGIYIGENLKPSKAVIKLLGLVTICQLTKGQKVIWICADTVHKRK